jgi:hypothetical protein
VWWDESWRLHTDLESVLNPTHWLPAPPDLMVECPKETARHHAGQRGCRDRANQTACRIRNAIVGSDVAMLGRFSAFLEEVARRLPLTAKSLVWGDLNLTLRDWYTSGISAPEAARRINRAL